jgi:putative two-component system response regulator
VTLRGVSALVVDDERAARAIAMRMLSAHGLRCAEAVGVPQALDVVADDEPEVVLTDISMPEGSGVALVRELHASWPDVATLVVTGSDDREVASEALDAGAFGYLIKPYDESELLIAVEGALRRRQLALQDRDDRYRLEADTVERLARAVESRDAGTAEHVDRMSELAGRLARRIGWTDDHAEMLRLACVLHDVGKVGIPDGILRKPGALTAGERAVVETHPTIGHAILAGAKSSLLRLADEVAWTHHERVDGTGYPRGLAGAEIPLAGRVAAVADVFDALTSDRPYRNAVSRAEALAAIAADPGFDRAVVAALAEIVGSPVTA